MAKDGDVTLKVLTPVKAIREKCLDCSCGSYKEVELCPMTKCALHPYRLGHRPGWVRKPKKASGAGSERNVG